MGLIGATGGLAAVFVGGIAVTSFGAGVGAAYYDYKAGPKANYQGALNASADAWPDGASYVFEHAEEGFDGAVSQGLSTIGSLFSWL